MLALIDESKVDMGLWSYVCCLKLSIVRWLARGEGERLGVNDRPDADSFNGRLDEDLLYAGHL